MRCLENGEREIPVCCFDWKSAKKTPNTLHIAGWWGGGVIEGDWAEKCRVSARERGSQQTGWRLKEEGSRGPVLSMWAETEGTRGKLG